MNRFTTLLISRRCAAFVSLAIIAGSALAQTPPVRPFPPQALRGSMQITTAPDLLMDGKPDRLSPGARIRGANNMVVMSAAIAGQKFLVNYVREPGGMIHEVWILTDAEARQVLPTGGLTLVK